MKKSIVALSMFFVLNASATTLHAPDQIFLESAKPFGITQQNWDNGKSAKLTLQNAYRFTYSH